MLLNTLNVRRDLASRELHAMDFEEPTAADPVLVSNPLEVEEVTVTGRAKAEGPRTTGLHFENSA